MNTCDEHVSIELLAQTTNNSKSYASVWTSYLQTEWRTSHNNEQRCNSGQKRHMQ